MRKKVPKKHKKAQKNARINHRFARIKNYRSRGLHGFILVGFVVSEGAAVKVNFFAAPYLRPLSKRRLLNYGASLK